jgi:hypothetical protein
MSFEVLKRIDSVIEITWNLKKGNNYNKFNSSPTQ